MWKLFSVHCRNWRGTRRGTVDLLKLLWMPRMEWDEPCCTYLQHSHFVQALTTSFKCCCHIEHDRVFPMPMTKAHWLFQWQLWQRPMTDQMLWQPPLL